ATRTTPDATSPTRRPPGPSWTRGPPAPARETERVSRIHWGDVKVLYVREMRAALRERAIVINSIVLPIVLYPVLLWLMFTGLTFVQGLAEGFDSRVVLRGLPDAHAEIADTLDARGDIERVD